jgi:hypothetical protein
LVPIPLGAPDILNSVVVVFLISSSQIPGEFSLEQDRFLPDRFQFVFHLTSCHLTLFNTDMGTVVKEPLPTQKIQDMKLSKDNAPLTIE